MVAVNVGPAAVGGSGADLQTRGYVPVGDLGTTPLQQSAIAIIFLMMTLALLTWGTRMYSRFSTKQLGIGMHPTEDHHIRNLPVKLIETLLIPDFLDDWLVTAAMVRVSPSVADLQISEADDTTLQAFSVALTIPYYMFIKYDYVGFKTADLPPTYDIEPMLFWNWIMQVLYNPILALVKSSILIFLQRLGGHRRSIRYAIYGLNAFNLTMMVAVFLTVIFQTIPINAFWDLSVPKQRQIDGPLFYISTSIITIITDFLVLLIPFWIFLGLKMRVAAKVGLIVVFLMGGVVSIVAIIRVHELRKKFYVKGYDSRDTLGDTLSSVEVNLAIMACCGPALRPLFRRMFPGIFSNNSSKDTRDYNTPSRYGIGTGLHQVNKSTTATFPLKDMHMSKTHTEIRGHSPNGSEEEIMTYNGIIRKTAVNIKYDQATMSDKDSGPDDLESVHPRGT
ncbi:CFEM domain-containing [Fusarium albosuccineum]|uniref:CFEM domain-containing n=1 Tax=Fusarium albosuccineum TaxID=1237068 RepID=A0A8H4LFQ7_9HYPO|nr:CFEM domain-containing [Fusarium albosuccineum]